MTHILEMEKHQNWLCLKYATNKITYLLENKKPNISFNCPLVKSDSLAIKNNLLD